MFPKGSPELVESIYKNAVLSAPFNEQLTKAIRAYALHMLQVCCTYHAWYQALMLCSSKSLHMKGFIAIQL